MREGGSPIFSKIANVSPFLNSGSNNIDGLTFKNNLHGNC